MQPNLRSVQARRVSIARELQDLRAEDAELQSVEAVLERLAQGSNPRASKPMPRVKSRQYAKAKSNGKALSQRDLILGALQRAPTPWLKSADIIRAAKQKHGVDLPARSIRPLLSNMKRSRQIVRRGRLVALPARVKAKK